MLNAGRYIDLDRRFRQLDPHAEPEREAVRSYTTALFAAEPGLAWKDILARSRVVVLGEPGSGKTWEFRERARSLRAGGEYAFFVRLDQLAGAPLDDILGAEGGQTFQKWRRSQRQATFFLDSVDEAKFRKVSDFSVALNRFREALGANSIARSRILISSRISEWRPYSDRHEVLECFPSPPERVHASSDSAVLESDEEPEGPLLVVQLEPLDRSRVETFAGGIGVPNPGGFVAALNQCHAWEFARRPLDVIDLANFWIAHGRFGSLPADATPDSYHGFPDFRLKMNPRTVPPMP